MQTIDEYIAACPEAIQPKLQALRQAIRSAEPELTERISWQMPTFYLKGNVIHFAAHKNHIGIYPGPEAITEFADRLTGYKSSKGAFQIPNIDPIDVDLIQDLVRANVKRNLEKKPRR